MTNKLKQLNHFELIQHMPSAYIIMRSFLKSNLFLSLSLSIYNNWFSLLQVVATDDERIAEICLGFGADVIMTSESCQNGEISGSTLLVTFIFVSIE